MNIYTKLREAVERSILGGTIEVVSEGTHSTVSYNNKTISPYLLLAELKKLEENPAGVDLGDDLKLAKEELEEMKHELRAKVGLHPLTKGPCQKHDTSCLVYHGKEPCHCWDNAPCTCGEEVHLPPLTKEEKDYYEGLRPKDVKNRWWYSMLENALLDAKADGCKELVVAVVDSLVAEARKKALEEVRDEVMSLEKKGDGELWQWRAFKVWLVNKFDEMK